MANYSYSFYISITLLAFSYLITRFQKRKENWFNPTIMFFLVWVINLCLYELDKYFQVFAFGLSQQADLWMSLSFTTFFVGSMVVQLCSDNKSIVCNENINASKLQIDNLMKISIILFFMFSSAVIYKYYLLYNHYGNPFNAMVQIRSEMHVGKFGFPGILNLFTLPAYLLVMNLAILSMIKRSIFIYFFAMATMVFVIFNATAVGMRGGIANSALLFVFACVATQIATGAYIRLIHIFYLAIFLCFVVVILGAILYFRSEGTISFLEGLLYQNYLYIVGPIPSYSYFMSHPWPTAHWGAWTFSGIYQCIVPVMHFFGIHGYIDKPLEAYYAPVLGSLPYNTSIYITYLYSDFGHIGIIIASLLFGMISNYCVNRLIKFRTIIDIQLMTIILTLLTLSIRGIMTNGASFWALLLLISAQAILLARFISRKNTDSIKLTKLKEAI